MTPPGANAFFMDKKKSGLKSASAGPNVSNGCVGTKGVFI